MKRNVLIILTGIIVLISTACGKYEHINGNHDVVTKTRAVSNFDAIVTEGSFDVEYVYAANPSIELNGESNLLEYVITEMDGSELTIRKMRNVSFHTHQTIVVTCFAPDVDYIRTDGSGDVYFDTLVSGTVMLETNGSGDMIGVVDCNRLEATSRGSGDMVIKGEANESELRIEGSGEIDAYDCLQSDCDARIKGSGDIYTWVTNHLEARIDGSGDIFYKGNPTVSTTIHGNGSVVHN